ncbi:MAG TPA: CDP-alcohol phosphatidyltransferase family protein [Bryobacteraceae bacterium]|nr:CDP-alcohol phosphatidyltransferase family protein [Bryobacteraceae bacterium]
MAKGEFQNAKRDQSSLLAPLEKRALLWFAHRMPECVNSDHLTALGFVAMLVTGVSYWLARWNRAALVAGIVCLALNWFGDSLDGTLARVRNRQRPRYGFYVDHITDSIGTTALLGGLAFSTFMSEWVGLCLLVVFLLMSIQSYLATYALGTFQLSFWKFSPTELRVLLIAGNIALLVRGPMARLAGRTFLLFDIGGIAGIVGMTAMLLVSTLRTTRTLYRLEPLDKPARSETE